MATTISSGPASEKKKAFTRYTKKYSEGTGVTKEVERIEKHCTILRAICHTQVVHMSREGQEQCVRRWISGWARQCDADATPCVKLSPPADAVDRLYGWANDMHTGGIVGTAIGGSKLERFAKAAAIEEFERLFLEKTGFECRASVTVATPYH